MTLFIKELFSIGAVDSGDNPGAEIVFWKRRKAKQTPDGGDTMEGGPMIGDFDLSGHPDAEALVAYVEKLEAERDAAIDAVPNVEELVAKATADAAAKTVEAEAKAAEAAAALEVEVAKSAHQALVAKIAADKIDTLLGAADEVATTLDEIAKAAPEAFATLYQNLVAAAQRADLSATIGKELGSNPGEAEEKTYEEKRDEYVAKRLEDDRTLTADQTTIFKLRSEFVQLNPNAGRSN
jgi:hypothetical protein